MAERRMFHASVVGSDAFLDLPVGVQALYFQLGMQADDDGFVNCPKQVARKLKRTQKDLQLLIDQGFLLEFDTIVVLRHWRTANNWQTDRISLPRYPEIAEKIFLTTEKVYEISKKPGSKNLLALKKKMIRDYGIRKESKGNPDGIPEEKKSDKKKREKKRLEKRNIEECVSGADTAGAAAHTPDTQSQLKIMGGKLGKGVLRLSDEQLDDLIDRLGLDGFDTYSERLADFILKNNATVANHYATILKWWEEDKGV